MKNVFETRNITNEQLEGAFGKQLNTGRVVLIHTEPTKNPEWVSCYFAQKREVESRGSAPSGQLSSIVKSLKGWDNSTGSAYIVRHIENLNLAALEEAKIDVGTTLDASVLIGVEDKYEPMTPNQDPIVSKDGDVRKCEGKAIYVHTSLTTKEEYAGDKVMKFDYTPVAAPVTQSFHAMNSK